MTKYCKSCGAALEDDAVFCDECGTSISVASHATYQNSPFSAYKIDMLNGERIIRSSQIHIGCLYLPLIVIVICFFFFIIIPIVALIAVFIGIIWLIVRFIGYTNNDLILTNKRVFGKCGLISTTQMQSPLNKIDSVSFKNGLFGKLIGYGTVEIATTSSHFKFRFIRDGQTFYNDIFNQLEISEMENRTANAKAIVDAMDEKLS